MHQESDFVKGVFCCPSWKLKIDKAATAVVRWSRESECFTFAPPARRRFRQSRKRTHRVWRAFSLMSMNTVETAAQPPSVPSASDGLVGKRVSVNKDRGSFFYYHEGTCLAYYLEPNPMGDGHMGAAIHLLCDDGKVLNLHVYPGLVEVLVIPNRRPTPPTTPTVTIP